jgi:hypothetical protein
MPEEVAATGTGHHARGKVSEVVRAATATALAAARAISPRGGVQTQQKAQRDGHASTPSTEAASPQPRTTTPLADAMRARLTGSAIEADDRPVGELATVDPADDDPHCQQRPHRRELSDHREVVGQVAPLTMVATWPRAGCHRPGVSRHEGCGDGGQEADQDGCGYLRHP